MTDASLEKERQALELRRAGVTFDKIATQVGYANRSVARSAYLRALARAASGDTAVEARTAEVDRLDRLQVVLWQRALTGDLPSIDRVLKIGEARERLQAEPKRNAHELRRAFDSSVKASTSVTPVDAAAVAAGRKIADRIDEAIASGEGQELTKALYLTPHMMNILRELLATPAARLSAAGTKPEGGTTGGRLQLLQGQARGTRSA